MYFFNILRNKKRLHLIGKGCESKVLIITYDMVPNTASWGGSQRMYFLANQLQRNGYLVTVYSVDKCNESAKGHPISFQNRQRRIKNRLLSAFIQSRAKNRITDTKDLANNEFKDNGIISSLRSIIKSNTLLLKIFQGIDAFFFNEPTFLAGPICLEWKREYKEEIRDYIKQNDIQNVIISCPSFHLFAFGPYLKKQFGDSINLIYDYRDPWNLWKKASVLCRLREEKYLKSCDHLVCTNRNLIEAFIKEFCVTSNKCKEICNGYSELNWENIVGGKYKRDSTFVLSYVGSIEIIYQGIRNVEKLIEAYRQFSKNKSDILLRFVGVNDTNLATVTALKNEFKEKIEFISRTSPEESLKYMLDSDALLLLHTTDDNSSKYIVSGKMYDYIRAGKPILSIGANNGIHKKMVDQMQLGISAQDDIGEINAGLFELYENWKKNKVIKKISQEDIKKMSREAQNEEYKQLFR